MIHTKDLGFVVVHIPHSSFYIPEEYKKDFLITEDLLQKELAQMTDSYCDELYDAPEIKNKIIAPVSRLICDMERFRDDKHESNSKRGHGLMYTKTSTGKRLRENDQNLRNRILDEFYDPHHRCFEKAVENALKKYNKCLIIDAHSFNSKKIVKIGNLFGLPDFDIGTDKFHTPDILSYTLFNKIKELGYRPCINSPSSGAITPMKFYRKDRRVLSIMIETNRKLYMDESTLQRSSHFEKISCICRSLMLHAAHSANDYFNNNH